MAQSLSSVCAARTADKRGGGRSGRLTRWYLSGNMKLTAIDGGADEGSLRC